jgi:hypothetical protein
MIPASGFPQSGYYAAPTAVGTDGQWAHAAPVPVVMRVEPSFAQSSGVDGQTGQYAGTELLTPTPMLLNGLVWLPGRNPANRDEALVVQEVRPATDLGGVADYQVVRL